MPTPRIDFVGGFAGASMAGNVATLHAVRCRPTWHSVLKEFSTAPWRPLTNISSRSTRFRYLRTGCLPEKPLDG
jgi:hypothetical protein